MLNPDSESEEIIEEILSLIKRAAVDKKHPMHFMILGTTNEKTPEMRYVVWRSFNPKELTGQIYTDKRSDKINHFRNNPLAQLLFYHPGRKCQIKVNVEVLIHVNTPETNAIFKEMQNGREAYNTLEAPGTKHNNFEDTKKIKPEFNSEDFVILETKFLSMEVLELNSPNHVRFAFNFKEEKLDWLVP